MVRKVLPGSINVAAACQRKEDTGFTQIPSSTHSEQAWHQSGGDTVGFDSSVGQCFFMMVRVPLFCNAAWHDHNLAFLAQGMPNLHVPLRRWTWSVALALSITVESCGGQVQWYARCDPKQVLQEVGRFSWSTSQHESAPSREISLEVLAFNPSLDKPVWAEVLSNRFVDGPEKALLKDLKDAFESEFGRATSEQSPLAILGLTAQCLWTLVGSLSQVAQMPAERQVVKPDIAFSCIFSGPGPLWAPISFGLFFLYFNLFYPPLWTLQCLLEACCNPLKEWKAGCGFAERLHPVAGQSIGITDGGECWWTLWLWNGQLRWSHCKSLR